jgi:hypothetical protein
LISCQGLARQGSGPELDAASVKLQDLTQALVLKVSLARQHHLQTLIRQVEALRVLFHGFFSQASKLVQGQTVEAAAEGPQTKALERLLNVDE